MVGSEDSSVPASACEGQQDEGRKLGKDVETIIFSGVHHGFDGNVSGIFNHAKWGKITMQPNARATERARLEVIETFKQVFGTDMFGR